MNAVELIKLLEEVYSQHGYSIIFLASFIEISPLGWAIPGGMLLAIGGFYAYSGRLSLFGVLLFSWLGAWSTFILAYLLGNSSGEALIKKLKQERTAERAKILLNKYGAPILTTSLMANFTRFWVAYIAGVQKFSFIKFLFYSGAASLTWASLMVVIGYIVGSERLQLEGLLSKLGILSWVLFAVAAYTVYFFSLREFKNIKEGK